MGLISSGARIEIKKLSTELQERALFDPESGLARRVVLYDRLRHAMKRADRYDSTLWVLSLGLEVAVEALEQRFEGRGDELVQRMSDRLRTACRMTDAVGRAGSYEFIVVLEQVDSRRGAETAARRILEKIAEEGDGAQGGSIGVHAGLALYPHHGGSAEALVAHAAEAMYRAKAFDGNGYQVYEEAGPERG